MKGSGIALGRHGLRGRIRVRFVAQEPVAPGVAGDSAGEIRWQLSAIRKPYELNPDRAGGYIDGHAAIGQEPWSPESNKLLRVAGQGHAEAIVAPLWASR